METLAVSQNVQILVALRFSRTLSHILSVFSLDIFAALSEPAMGENSSIPCDMEILTLRLSHAVLSRFSTNTWQPANAMFVHFKRALEGDKRLAIAKV